MAEVMESARQYQSSFSPLHQATSAAPGARRAGPDVPRFQSPSRGGHLCGTMTEGETSSSNCFSPLHEGDPLAAPTSALVEGRCLAAPFQSPFHQGSTLLRPVP